MLPTKPHYVCHITPMSTISPHFHPQPPNGWARRAKVLPDGTGLVPGGNTSGRAQPARRYSWFRASTRRDVIVSAGAVQVATSGARSSVAGRVAGGPATNAALTSGRQRPCTMV